MKHYQQECEDSVNSGLFLANDELDSSDNDEKEYADDGYIELSDNEVILKFSITLMNKLKKSAFEEGLEIDELAEELITEGLAQRAGLDANRAGPSHLMTRTGYLSPDANGQTMKQPLLSHHQGNSMGQNRNARGRANNNRRGPQQQRNQAGRNGGGNQQRPHQGGGHRGRGRP